MSLKCITGYALTGDTTVTCKEGRTFSFDNAPACKIGMRNQLGNHSRTLIYRASRPEKGSVNRGAGRKLNCKALLYLTQKLKPCIWGKGKVHRGPVRVNRGFTKEYLLLKTLACFVGQWTQVRLLMRVSCVTQPTHNQSHFCFLNLVTYKVRLHSSL